MKKAETCHLPLTQTDKTGYNVLITRRIASYAITFLSPGRFFGIASLLMHLVRRKIAYSTASYSVFSEFPSKKHCPREGNTLPSRR